MMIYQTNSLNWFTLLIVLIIATYCVLHPLIQAKLSTLHHARLQQALKLAGHFAALIVPEIAVMSHVGKAERKTEAIRFVTARLNHHGVTLPQPVISTAVEKAYQLYKHLVTGDQHLDL